MQFNEFKRLMLELSDPNRADPSKKPLKRKCKDCGIENEISSDAWEITCLVVRFVINDEVGGITKEQLLQRLGRINQACQVVPSRTDAEAELFGQASVTLSRLATMCESFEEFATIISKVDHRLTQSPGQCVINLNSLTSLIEGIKTTQ